MKAINRIKEYIDYKGLNNSIFEKRNNLSNGYIGTQLKRNSDLGEGVLNRILDNCLDVNPVWLLTGEGEMLKETQSMRLRKLLDYFEMSWQEMEKILDLQLGTINDILVNNSDVSAIVILAINEKYPQINTNWLQSGEGEMLNIMLNKEVEGETLIAKESPAAYNIINKPRQHIPLIPIESIIDFNQEDIINNKDQYEWYSIPVFGSADYLTIVSGNSMSPTYNSGDIVACKKIILSDNFFLYNRVYVLDTEFGILIRRIKQGNTSDTITIISDNADYPPQELPVNKIKAMSLVVGVIRSE